MEQGTVNIAQQIVAALTPVGPITPWGDANANIFPRMVYHKISGTDNDNLRGAGPQRRRYQIDCYATTFAAASGLADAARVALRAGMIIGGITDNPDNFEADVGAFSVSFDITAWST